MFLALGNRNRQSLKIHSDLFPGPPLCMTFSFYLLSSLLLVLDVLGGNNKPYIGSLESWSEFPRPLLWSKLVK